MMLGLGDIAPMGQGPYSAMPASGACPNGGSSTEVPCYTSPAPTGAVAAACAQLVAQVTASAPAPGPGAVALPGGLPYSGYQDAYVTVCEPAPAGQNIVSTMPTLPPSACTASQTYIPPGGTFTTGPSAGQVTSTGACQDGASATALGLSTGTLAAIGGGLLLLVLAFGGRK